MGQQNMAGEKTLAAWREEIDALDAELLRMLNQRAAIACEIAVIKVAAGLPAYDPGREALVLADHNSYHLGQLVDLRRALGSWPEQSKG